MFRQSDFPPPPLARRQGFVHPDGRSDPWAWLRDPAYPEVTNPEIRDYLETENAYVETVLGGAKDRRPALLAELKSRIVEDKRGPPEWQHGVWLWWRFEPGRQYRQTCLAETLETAKANQGRVIFDQNERAAGCDYYALGDLALSPNRRHLAVLEDREGAERLVLRVKDLATGDFLPVEIGDCAYGIEWANDSARIFYVKQDAQLRPRSVHMHRLGQDPATDELVYREADPSFYLNIFRSPSGRYLSILLFTQTASEQWALELDAAAANPVCLNPRRPGHQYFAFDRKGEWLIRTNDRHANFRIVRAPLTQPAEAFWREVVAPSDEVFIEWVGGSAYFWWLTERTTEARQRVRLICGEQTSDRAAEEIAFPDPIYALWVVPGYDWQGRRLRLRYETPARPETYFDYSIDAKRLEVVQETAIPCGHDPEDYILERRWALAPDGERAPLSIVRGKDVPLDGSAPLLLYGYGAYGGGLDAFFCPNRLSLLKRGFIYAIAHVRGGNERGKRWYEEGKFLKKQNSFTDFIAAAEDLIAAGYGQKGRLACMGASAGGLLVAAAINRRPDLWGAAVAKVPFVDVLSTLLDETLPLTAYEYSEWGDPRDPTYYDYIQGYSPYDQIRAQAYPPILVTGGLSDPRVTYWEPAKWTAKLRATKTDDQLLLFRTKMTVGHFGASGRYDALGDIAETYAFLFAVFGISG